MLCITHDKTDPFFNLASEEYVLRNFSDDCFMLWRNRPSIIVGKHQNTLSEINVDYVRKHQIPVVRRLSGGGAVFHDLGNLNFTFIVSGETGKLVDFRKFTRPVLEVLQKLGINARFEGRNDLTIERKKFSGNAEHVFKNRVLHHGTLLFSSVISDLSDALRVNPLKFTDKAVKSVRSRVTNISEHLKTPIDVLAFRDMIMEHVMETNAGAVSYVFSPEDLEKIDSLVKTKYNTWEWNYGYSPDYGFKKSIRYNGGFIEFHLDVKKGFIHDIRIYGDFFNSRDIKEITDLLKGMPHDPEQIMGLLRDIPLEEYFHGIDPEEFIKGLF